LINRLAAAGFAAPVIAAITGQTVTARDTATPAATPAFTSMFTPISPGDPAADLAAIGKDPDLISFGGFNIGTPTATMDGLDIPNSRFFVRTHGPTMTLDDPATYMLQVAGLVDTPLTLTLDDLTAMPQRTVHSFLECSGNSRRYFQPPASGNPWGNNAIGNAEWSGVSLADVLDAAGVKDGAVDVVSQGGDFAEMQRGLPIDTAMDRDTIIALKMNGENLPDPHGGPARLLVPGWGGIASTKWLIGLTVLDTAFQGDFNNKSYVIIDATGQAVRPVREMPVKSIITAPEVGASLAAGDITVAGYAWSGLGGIAAVEVSTDNGVNWTGATITEEGGPLAWVRFEHVWTAPAGSYTLLTRATDTRGISQPFDQDWNAKGYQYNEIQEVPVEVTA
jgi:DMSO/TMAO reductase YedYZ molybdopterin-dependent catalytic subunit